MSKIGQLKQSAIGFAREIKQHWSVPSEGNYVPYKEIVCYSITGFGRELVGNLLGSFGLGAGSFLLAIVWGIRPTHLLYMSIMLTVVNIFSSFIRAKIIDSTRTRWGRFRPYILFSGFPVVAMCIVFVFINPFYISYVAKLVIIFLFVT
ncbi:MAG: MFS transporter, partial [Clostridiales bacterium]|nr:MFS transporter [Clostridiales bacterium]